MDDSTIWSEEDFRQGCKVGFTVAGGLVGGAVGAFGAAGTGGAGIVAMPVAIAYGAALGLGTALLVCPRVSPEKVRRFLSGEPVSRNNAGAIMNALGAISGVRDKKQLLVLAAAARHAHRTRAAVASEPASSRSPAADARVLLTALGSATQQLLA